MKKVKILLSTLVVALLMGNPAIADGYKHKFGRYSKHAITIWIFNWNGWQNCANPMPSFNNTNCTEPDIFSPGTDLGLLYLTGGVSDHSGNITLAGSMYETADRTPYPFGVDPLQRGIGLRDAQTAEIQFLIRNHGPIVKPQPNDQLIQLIDQYCTVAGGDRECEDLLLGAFPVGAVTSPLYDLADAGSPTPAIYGCSQIYRDDGIVRVVVHANVKRKKTRWLRKTCGM